MAKGELQNIIMNNEYEPSIIGYFRNKEKQLDLVADNWLVENEKPKKE